MAEAKQMYTENHVNERKTLVNMKETEICLLYMKTRLLTDHCTVINSALANF